jgi:hypothetical protein
MQSRRLNTINDFYEDVMNWFYVHGVLVTPPDGHSLEWSDLTAPSAMAKIDAAVKLNQMNSTVGDGMGPKFTVDEIRKEAGYKPLTDDIEMPDETLDDDPAKPEGDQQDV